MKEKWMKQMNHWMSEWQLTAVWFWVVSTNVFICECMLLKIPSVWWSISFLNASISSQCFKAWHFCKDDRLYMTLFYFFSSLPLGVKYLQCFPLTAAKKKQPVPTHINQKKPRCLAQLMFPLSCYVLSSRSSWPSPCVHVSFPVQFGCYEQHLHDTSTTNKLSKQFLGIQISLFITVN